LEPTHIFMNVVVIILSRATEGYQKHVVLNYYEHCHITTVPTSEALVPIEVSYEISNGERFLLEVRVKCTVRNEKNNIASVRISTFYILLYEDCK
jgi:hypothetical protein